MDVPTVIETTAVGLVIFKISNIITGLCWAILAFLLWRVRKLHPLGGGSKAVVVMMLTMVIWSALRVCGIYMIAYPWMTGILTGTTLIATIVVAKAILTVPQTAADMNKVVKAIKALNTDKA